MREDSLIAQRTAKIDGLAKAPGDAAFAIDICLSVMLWAKALQSLYPHPLILSIDIEKTKTPVGVKTVITPGDECDAEYACAALCIGMLARHNVRCIGESVN